MRSIDGTYTQTDRRTDIVPLHRRSLLEASSVSKTRGEAGVQAEGIVINTCFIKTLMNAGQGLDKVMRCIRPVQRVETVVPTALKARHLKRRGQNGTGNQGGGVTELVY